MSTATCLLASALTGVQERVAQCHRNPGTPTCRCVEGLISQCQNLTRAWQARRVRHKLQRPSHAIAGLSFRFAAREPAPRTQMLTTSRTPLCSLHIFVLAGFALLCRSQPHQSLWTNMRFFCCASLASLAIATASDEATTNACLREDDVTRLVQGFKAIISQNPVNQTLAAETIADNFTSISDSVNYVDQIPVRLGDSSVLEEGRHAD